MGKPAAERPLNGFAVQVWVVADEKAASGCRRERHRDLKLGVILAAGALIGFGPAGIEDILAAGMALQISERDSDQCAVWYPRQHVLRLPAGPRSHRMRILQRG